MKSGYFLDSSIILTYMQRLVQNVSALILPPPAFGESPWSYQLWSFWGRTTTPRLNRTLPLRSAVHVPMSPHHIEEHCLEALMLFKRCLKRPPNSWCSLSSTISGRSTALADSYLWLPQTSMKGLAWLTEFGLGSWAKEPSSVLIVA